MERKNMGKTFIKNTLFMELVVVILVVVAGALGFHFIEHRSFLDSLYFIVMTMSTIGFGDITPQTSAGKLLVIVYAFMGVPVFLSISGLILESRFNKHIKKYIAKVHKEIHGAEEDIIAMEKRVSTKLGDVLEETRENAEDVQEVLEETTGKKSRWKTITRK